MVETGREFNQFNRLVESLNDKTTLRLMRVWPRRHPTEVSASPYVRNEAKFAHYAQAGHALIFS